MVKIQEILENVKILPVTQKVITLFAVIRPSHIARRQCLNELSTTKHAFLALIANVVSPSFQVVEDKLRYALL